MLPESGLQRFVRGLLQGAAGQRQGEVFVLRDGRRANAASVLDLIQGGAIAGDGETCFATPETATWLRRARLDRDAFAAQHRLSALDSDGIEHNLAESPLSRLAAGIGGEAYLERHQVEAGERVRKLVERAQLQPRLTMTYSAARTAGITPQMAGEITDLAADARRSLAEIHRVLPRDCAGVVMDVCGLLKGLQDVERERGWPRRSAKLVLRIGLDHLAQHYGLGPFAVGKGKPRHWLAEGARPERFE